VLYHGVGLADIHPTLPHAADWTTTRRTACWSQAWCYASAIGRLGGHEIVKIEEQI
jgi:hypothetical protein